MAGLAHAHDVTLLSNWELSSQEEWSAYQEALSDGRRIVFDLSDQQLLARPRIREQLRLATLVTVPTEHLKKEVQTLAARVAVTPSCVDLPYFLQANTLPKPERSHIGLFGPFDWQWAHPLLASFKQKHPEVVLLAGPEASAALGDLVQPLVVHVENYAVVLHACLFGVISEALQISYDPIWQAEYGILCKPTVILAPRFGKSAEQMLADLSTYLIAEARAKAGQQAFEQAYPQRATVLASTYARVLRKNLPDRGGA